MTDDRNKYRGVLIRGGGILAIEGTTPLVHNQWFDGKFLRADDLAREQKYLTSLLRLSNQAGGFGVVHGLDVKLDGTTLFVEPGLAIAPRGDAILLTMRIEVNALDLIIGATGNAAGALVAGEAVFGDCAAIVAPPVGEGEGAKGGLYRLSLCRAEAACGHEDIYGSLCDQACVTDSKRPDLVEGALLRAVRATEVKLATPPKSDLDATTDDHLRSRWASALFRHEDSRTPPFPGGLEGTDGHALALGPWCVGATVEVAACDVTLGYFLWHNGKPLFVDEWSGRRERMITQAEGYWRHRTRMRPLPNFLAQVAQFQCQLATLPIFGPKKGKKKVKGPCGELHESMLRVELMLGKLQERYAHTARILAERGANLPEDLRATADEQGADLEKVIAELLKARTKSARDAQRVLPGAGIVELPPAGFLPVATDAGDVEAQVQLLLGEGVDLQVCTAPLDAIGTLFEQARHSARTSLLDGLADARKRHELQIVVPDGRVDGKDESESPAGWQVEIPLGTLGMMERFILEPLEALGATSALPERKAVFRLAARAAEAPHGAGTPAVAEFQDFQPDETGIARTRLEDETRRIAYVGMSENAFGTAEQRFRSDAFAEIKLVGDPFAGQPPFSVAWSARMRMVVDLAAGGRFDIDFDMGGALRVDSRTSASFAGLDSVFGQKAEVVRTHATLSGTLAIGSLGTSSPRPETTGIRFTLDAYLVRAVQGGQTICALVPATPNHRLAFYWRTEADPVGRTVVVSLERDPRVKSELELIENDDVATAAVPPPPPGTPDGPQEVIGLLRAVAPAPATAAPAAPQPAPTPAVAGVGERLTTGLRINTATNGAGARRKAAVMLVARGSDSALSDVNSRARALDSIDRIASAAKDAGFRDEARDLLFAESARAGRMRVRAVHEWVLFRRPIGLTCAAPIPVMTPEPSTYAVFVLSLKEDPEDELAPRIFEQLVAGWPPDESVHRSLAVPVQYLGQTPDPAAPRDLITPFTKTNYTGAVYGAVASSRSGRAVDELRADALAEALASLAQPETQRLRFAEAVRLDPSFAYPGADGILVFIVRPRREGREEPAEPVAPGDADPVVVVEQPAIVTHLVLLHFPSEDQPLDLTEGLNRERRAGSPDLVRVGEIRVGTTTPGALIRSAVAAAKKVLAARNATRPVKSWAFSNEASVAGLTAEVAKDAETIAIQLVRSLLPTGSRPIVKNAGVIGGRALGPEASALIVLNARRQQNG